MNSVNLIGRLTRDPETNTSASGMTISKFTLAVNRMKGDEADFIRCVSFGKTAENIDKYMSKGRQLGVTGHIQTGSYDAQDGHKVYTTDVIVDRAEFIGSKSEPVPPRDAPKGTPAPSYTPPEGFTEVDDEDLPF